MRRSPITKALSLILIPFMIISSGGCSPSQDVARLDDHKDEPIRITTKDQTQYELVTWKVLNDRGDIAGKGVKKVRQSVHLPLRSSPFQGTIQAATIRSLEFGDSTTSEVEGLFIGLGVILGILVLALILWPPTIFPMDFPIL